MSFLEITLILSFRSYPQSLPPVLAHTDNIVAGKQFRRIKIGTVGAQGLVGISHQTPECGHPLDAFVVFIHLAHLGGGHVFSQNKRIQRDGFVGCNGRQDADGEHDHQEAYPRHFCSVRTLTDCCFLSHGVCIFFCITSMLLLSRCRPWPPMVPPAAMSSPMRVDRGMIFGLSLILFQGADCPLQSYKFFFKKGIAH